MALEPLVEPNDEFEAGAIRVQRGEDTPTPTIDYKGKTLKLFYGDLHEHTAVSVCNRAGDQSIDESYQHMRDITRLDFACVTDHGYNINPYLWGLLAKLAEKQAGQLKRGQSNQGGGSATRSQAARSRKRKQSRKR